MTYPITPPPELRRQWIDNDDFPFVSGTCDLLSITRDRLNSVMDQAVSWGADQELDACCEWFQEFYKTESWVKHDLKHFRAARRPKPPSLKEQALLQLDTLNADLAMHGRGCDLSQIRRALEQLPD